MAYLNAQIAAGAEVVMLFDSWGGILSTPAYHEFSLRYLKEIVSRIAPSPTGEKVPVIVFTKGGALWLESIAETGCDAVGLDWTVSIGEARRQVGDKVALQGNLDPCVLLGSHDSIQSEVARILKENQGNPGFIFNLGHGILPQTPIENVDCMLDALGAV